MSADPAAMIETQAQFGRRPITLTSKALRPLAVCRVETKPDRSRLRENADNGS
jgi:hypothetical protein